MMGERHAPMDLDLGPAKAARALNSHICTQCPGRVKFNYLFATYTHLGAFVSVFVCDGQRERAVFRRHEIPGT